MQSPMTPMRKASLIDPPNYSPCEHLPTDITPASFLPSPPSPETFLLSSPTSPSYPSPLRLPEIISFICSYLDQPALAAATRLNRVWSSVALPLLYREIALSGPSFKIDSLELGLLRHGRFCQKFTAARDVNHWCSRVMVALGRMPNLLDLEATWMNADLLEALIHLQKLERLSIARLQGSQPEGNPYFEPSFQGSKRIKELNMADSSQMTDSALVSITKTCPQIQVLTVSGNRCLTHEGLIRWCQQLSSTARHPPLSSQASPPYYYYSLNNPSLSIPKALQTKHEGMTELTTINFANCNRIQSEGFQALFECSHHLKHVNLMSTRVEDEALRVLSTRNLGLQSIILNCCAAISDQGLQMLLKFSRNLDSVSFLYCHRITVRVFFQTLWRCLGLKELRFSLNARHKDLIENGLELNGDPGQEQEDQGLSAASSVIAPSSKKLFHEAQLEFLIFGKPEADDIELSHAGANVVNSRGNGDDALALTDPHMDAAGMSSTSVQEYRQRLILAQIYRQIERLVCLQTLDMRDIHLPLDLDSGLARLGRLERLQVLELTGLDKPLGPAEVDWLVGVCDESSAYVSDKEVGQQHQTEVEVVQDVTKACELDNKHRHFHSLDTLVFKGGYSLSTPQLEKLRTSRPRLDVQLIQVKDHVS